MLLNFELTPPADRRGYRPQLQCVQFRKAAEQQSSAGGPISLCGRAEQRQKGAAEGILGIFEQLTRF